MSDTRKLGSSEADDDEEDEDPPSRQIPRLDKCRRSG